MGLIDKILDWIIGRMRQEDKEKLAEKVVEKFFDTMTPEEKEHVIENMILKMFEGVDMKDFFPRMMIALWKDNVSTEDNRGILNAMSKMASDTGGKITEFIPSSIKKKLVREDDTSKRENDDEREITES